MPDTNAAWSERRNATTAAISSAVPKRPSGVLSNIVCITGWFANSWRPMGVSISPGESETTRAPRGPQRTAALAASSCTPFFDHAYARPLSVSSASTRSRNPAACGSWIRATSSSPRSSSGR